MGEASPSSAMLAQQGGGSPMAHPRPGGEALSIMRHAFRKVVMCGMLLEKSLQLSDDPIRKTTGSSGKTGGVGSRRASRSKAVTPPPKRTDRAREVPVEANNALLDEDDSDGDFWTEEFSKLREKHLMKSEDAEASEASGGSDAQGSDEDQQDGEEDGWDAAEEAAVVKELLEQFHADARAELMQELNEWHQQKLPELRQDLEILSQGEDDCSARQHESENLHAQFQRRFEGKQMRDVRLLNSCLQTIQRGAKRRRRFSIEGMLQSDEKPDETANKMEEEPKESPPELDARQRLEAHLSVEDAQGIYQEMVELPSQLKRQLRHDRADAASTVMIALGSMQESQEALKQRATFAEKSLLLYEAALKVLTMGGKVAAEIDAASLPGLEDKAAGEAVQLLVSSISKNMAKDEAERRQAARADLEEACRHDAQILEAQQEEIRSLAAATAAAQPPASTQKGRRLSARRTSTLSARGGASPAAGKLRRRSSVVKSETARGSLAASASPSHRPSNASHMKLAKLPLVRSLLQAMQEEHALLTYCADLAEKDPGTIFSSYAPPVSHDALGEEGHGEGEDAHGHHHRMRRPKVKGSKTKAAGKHGREHSKEAPEHNDEESDHERGGKLSRHPSKQDARVPSKPHGDSRDEDQRKSSNAHNAEEEKEHIKELHHGMELLDEEWKKMVKKWQFLPRRIPEGSRGVVRMKGSLVEEEAKMQAQIQSLKQQLQGLLDEAARLQKQASEVEDERLEAASMSPTPRSSPRSQRSFKLTGGEMPEVPSMERKSSSRQGMERKPSSRDAQLTPTADRAGPTTPAHSEALKKLIQAAADRPTSAGGEAGPKRGSASQNSGAAHAQQPTGGAETREDLSALDEFLKIKQKNASMQEEISAISQKLLALRSCLSQKGASIEIKEQVLCIVLGVSPDELRPPPEYYVLRDDIEAKRAEVARLKQSLENGQASLEALSSKVASRQAETIIRILGLDLSADTLLKQCERGARLLRLRSSTALQEEQSSSSQAVKHPTVLLAAGERRLQAAVLEGIPGLFLEDSADRQESTSMGGAEANGDDGEKEAVAGDVGAASVTEAPASASASASAASPSAIDPVAVEAPSAVSPAVAAAGVSRLAAALAKKKPPPPR